jgi:hypothetical protein
MAKKIYQSAQLTQEETTFWNAFPNSEKSYILTGDTAQTIDFTEYQKAGFSGEFLQQDIAVQEELLWQEPNLFFEPSSSDSDSSEDPDYIPPVPLRKIITTLDDSWPDNSNSKSFDQPSTSKQASELNNPALDSESDTSTDSGNQPNKIDTAPTTSPRGRPPGSKNITDSWKNTATLLWKPPRKVVVNPDPEVIATRTRSRQIQDAPDQMASHPHDLNIDAVCCDQNKQKRAESPISVQEDWKLCYKCALSSRKNPGQLIKNY